MDVWRFQVTNFDKQCKRVKKQTDVAASKTSKTSSFTDLANDLMSSSCPNNMMEIDDLATTLKGCNATVTAACELTKPNQTFVDECKKKTEDFVVSIHFT